MVKTNHDGDCSIYACLDNGNPDDGICTCGYGHEQRRECNCNAMYSKELQDKLGWVTDRAGVARIEQVFDTRGRRRLRCSHG